MKKLSKILIIFAIVPLLFAMFPRQDAHAEVMACIELSIQPEEIEVDPNSQDYVDANRMSKSMGVELLCAHNLDGNGNFQESSYLEGSWPQLSTGREGETGYQQRWAYFDWGKSRDVKIIGDMNSGHYHEEFGVCSWTPGESVTGEFQNCIIGVLQDKYLPEHYKVSKQQAKTAEEIYSDTQKEALDQKQEVMGYDPVDNDPVDNESNGQDQQKTCYNSGGAMSLGWIACPILDWLGNAAQDIYNDMVKPSLEVSPKLFSETQNEGTYKAWTVFQNFANIVFVIILLVVIFSQLTGIGIDNYGVKKILPKLIVVAILVNLSYYICLICVDLSNIIGNAVQNLFSSINVGDAVLSIDPSEATTLNGDPLSSIGLSGTLTSVGIIAALVVAVGAIWANPAIVLSLLVTGLGVIISILFLFILLAAREAAIVVMVVISPLAFICYALPNTKSLFDKWLNIGKGLLLVYPIAGLLVGGGDFVSRLLLSSGFATQGFPAALTAMVVGIIPIFFIPTVLRSSFAALGSLGAKIAGAGSRLSNYTTGKARNSEFYKSAQQMGLERKHRINAGEDTSAIGSRVGGARRWFANTRVGRLTGANRRYSNNYRTYLKDLENNGGYRDLSIPENRQRALEATQDKIERENEAAAAASIQMRERQGINNAEEFGGFDARTREAYYARTLDDAARNGDTSDMLATIEAMTKSGMTPGKQKNVFRSFANSDRFRSLSDEQKSQFLRQVATRHGEGFLAKDAEAKNWAQRGGLNADGTSMDLGNYGDYLAVATRNGWMSVNDMKPEDIGKLDDSSLAACISAGLITQQNAQRAVATNKNLAESNLIMLGAAADGHNLSGRSVEQIVQDTRDIMNNGSGSMGGQAVDNATYKKWTSPQPMRVTNVDAAGGGAAPAGGGGAAGGGAAGGGGTPPPEAGAGGGAGAPGGGGTGGPTSGAGGGTDDSSTPGGGTPSNVDNIINTYRSSNPVPDANNRYPIPTGFEPDILNGGIYRHRSNPNLTFDPLTGNFHDRTTGTNYTPYRT